MSTCKDDCEYYIELPKPANYAGTKSRCTLHLNDLQEPIVILKDSPKCELKKLLERLELHRRFPGTVPDGLR